MKINSDLCEDLWRLAFDMEVMPRGKGKAVHILAREHAFNTLFAI